MPRGMTEDPRGSRHWRPTARAEHNKAEGRRPASKRLRFPDEAAPADQWERSTVASEPALPLWRPCPVCNVLAEVSPKLLRSLVAE